MHSSISFIPIQTFFFNHRRTSADNFRAFNLFKTYRERLFLEEGAEVFSDPPAQFLITPGHFSSSQPIVQISTALKTQGKRAWTQGRPRFITRTSIARRIRSVHAFTKSRSYSLPFKRKQKRERNSQRPPELPAPCSNINATLITGKKLDNCNIGVVLALRAFFAMVESGHGRTALVGRVPRGTTVAKKSPGHIPIESASWREGFVQKDRQNSARTKQDPQIYSRRDSSNLLQRRHFKLKRRLARLVDQDGLKPQRVDNTVPGMLDLAGELSTKVTRTIWRSELAETLNDLASPSARIGYIGTRSHQWRHCAVPSVFKRDDFLTA
ncbi:hypothetical protein B0H13DRAFT_1883172 [Mycena leptocephala]|nr:hypothetical protein B0H13DRAFT_1883172 [Mycena leptocephala]